MTAIDASYLQRIDTLLSGGQRLLLGIVGAPGAGKSTLAQALHTHFADISQIVPMDGFHLAQAELERLGRAQRKGAADTFDSAGYAALLQRLRQQPADEVVYAPDFRRDLEEPIAGAIAVHPHTPLLICEGNYLLLNEGHWARIPALLDEVWYVDVPDALRRERLVNRHVQFGRSPEAAMAWVQDTDEPNARRIAQGRARADVVFSWS